MKLVSSLKIFIGTDDALYANLLGKHASETPQSTVPISILATSARADMVLIRGKEITLIELTVLYDSRKIVNSAKVRKSNKGSYLELLNDQAAFTRALNTGLNAHSMRIASFTRNPLRIH